MAVTSYELVTVESDFITVDQIVWRRYRLPTFGMVEILLDANPHLAKLHISSPFLPVGTQLRIPIDPGILKGSPQSRKTIQVWGKG